MHLFNSFGLNYIYNGCILKWDASFRWSFRPGIQFPHGTVWDSIETTTIGMTHPLYKGAHECKKGIFYYLDKIVFYMHHYQHCSFYYFHCGLSLVFLSERMIRQLTVNHIPKGENIIQ